MPRAPAVRCPGFLPSTGLALLLRLNKESQRYHYYNDYQRTSEHGYWSLAIRRSRRMSMIREQFGGSYHAM